MSCGRQAPGAQFSFREVEDDHARETHLFPGRAGPEEGHRCGPRRSRSPKRIVKRQAVGARGARALRLAIRGGRVEVNRVKSQSDGR